MPSAQNDNLSINYEIRGNGPPAILFSHSGASGLAWREDWQRGIYNPKTSVHKLIAYGSLVIGLCTRLYSFD